MKRALITFFILLVTVTLVSARTKAVIHVTFGALASQLESDEDLLTDLTLIGRLSIEDVLFFKKMESLEKLNLAEAEIPYNEIPNEAFRDKTTLRSIVLPNTLERIGRDAFNGCSALSYPVIIPSSVRTIGDRAFYNCPLLTQVTLSESLETIGDFAFYGTNLTGTLDLPASVTAIGHKAYYQCKGLTDKLVLPEGLTKLGTAAFARCNFNNRLVIPEGIHEIPDSAFAFNHGLVAVEWKAITSGIGTAAFDSCANLKELSDLEGVKSIGVAAFRNCIKLHITLTLPESLETLGQAAFANCRSLYGGIVIPKGIADIGGATSSDPHVNLNDYPEGVFENTLIQSLTLHMDIAFIHVRAFLNCRGLEGKIRIGVETVVGNNAFFNTGVSFVQVGHTYVRVDGQGNDSFKGANWATAYASLEKAVAALTAAQDETIERTREIYLQQGTYTLTGKITLPDDIILHGGFVGDEMRGTAKGGTLSRIRHSEGKTALQVGIKGEFSNMEIEGLLATNPLTLQADNLTLVNAVFQDSVSLQGTVRLSGTLSTSDLLLADTLILDKVFLQTPATHWAAEKIVIQDSLFVTWMNGLNLHPLFEVADKGASTSAPAGRMVALWQGERLGGSLSVFTWKDVEGVQMLLFSTIPQPEDFTFPDDRKLLRPGDTVTLNLSLGKGVTQLLTEHNYMTWNIVEGSDIASWDKKEFGRLITGEQPGRVIIEVAAFGRKRQIILYVAKIDIHFASESGFVPPGGTLFFDIVTTPPNIPFPIVHKLQNPEIAHLDGSQLIADARGTTCIHAWFSDYPAIEHKQYFVVQDIAETILITGTDSVWVPGKTYTFTAKIEPLFAYAQEVKWVVSDETVAVILNDDTYHPLTCKVQALTSKPAYIAATSVDGYAYAIHYFGEKTTALSPGPEVIHTPRVSYGDGALHLLQLDGYAITLHTLSARLVLAPRQLVTADAVLPVPDLLPGIYLLTATSPVAPPFVTKLLVQ
jgi:hypothetical protein